MALTGIATTNLAAPNHFVFPGQNSQWTLKLALGKGPNSTAQMFQAISQSTQDLTQPFPTRLPRKKEAAPSSSFVWGCDRRQGGVEDNQASSKDSACLLPLLLWPAEEDHQADCDQREHHELTMSQPPPARKFSFFSIMWSTLAGYVHFALACSFFLALFLTSTRSIKWSATTVRSCAQVELEGCDTTLPTSIEQILLTPKCLLVPKHQRRLKKRLRKSGKTKEKKWS